MKNILCAFIYLLVGSALANPYDSLEIKAIDSLNNAAYDIYYAHTDSSRNISDEALVRSVAIDYQRGQAKAHHTLGICYGIFGDFGKSLTHLVQADKGYRSISEKAPLGRILRNIGIILINEGNKEEALVYMKESYQILSELGENKEAASSLISVASLMGELNYPELEVLSSFTKAEEILTNERDIIELALGLNLKADYYLFKNERSKSIKTYHAVLEITQSYNSPYIRGYSYLGLAKAYSQAGKLDSAEWSTDLALSIYLPQRHKNSLESIYMLRAELFRIKKEYDNSILALQLAKAYSDSIQMDKREKELNLLRIEFDTERKNQAIDNLTQSSRIQELVLRQRSNQLLVGGLVFMSVILVGFFYYRSSRIKKEKTHSELENRFLRSQLNPHFIFNSMAAIQQYLLENDPEGAGHYMGMFSTLMRQILENSRSEFISLSEETNMLTNYLELQKMRFQDQFEYSIDIDEELDEDYAGVPPMFAQPFIENALEHGLFRNSGRENFLSIRFTKAGNQLIGLEIQDNGIGVESVVERKTHRSLGKTITMQRLQAMQESVSYKIGLQAQNIVSSTGEIEGHKVNLTLPTKLVAGR